MASVSTDARSLPDFLIVGTQRGGTTTLFKVLLEHPQIGGARMHKEVHYFDLNVHRGERWYRAHFPTTRSVDRARGREGRFAIGEASPYYLFHPRVPERARALLPSAKVIVLLRNPVSRTWSQYRHEVELGYESLSFEDALLAEPERTAGEAARLLEDPRYRSFEHQHHAYVARSDYPPQLEAWLASFPREQMLLLLSEDLFGDPAGTLRRVTSFLGLEDRDVGQIPRLNASSGASMRAETRERLWEQLRAQVPVIAELIGRDPGWER
jgi:sulfotransferase family protein